MMGLKTHYDITKKRKAANAVFRTEKKMNDLTGKVALITGGASGIGKACAFRFAKAGAAVFITDINEDNGKSVEKYAKNENLNISYVYADISNVADLRGIKNVIFDKYRKLNVLVNNAGIAPFTPPPHICQH